CELSWPQLPACSPDGAISAFTRVHSLSKTGVNALKDAPWRHPGLSLRASLISLRSIRARGRGAHRAPGASSLGAGPSPTAPRAPGAPMLASRMQVLNQLRDIA